jgi:hypothetical protein
MPAFPVPAAAPGAGRNSKRDRAASAARTTTVAPASTATIGVSPVRAKTNQTGPARTLRDRQRAEPDAWRHGYGIARDTALKSGTLYPILIRLADRGLVEACWEGWAAARAAAAALVPADARGAGCGEDGAGPGPGSRTGPAGCAAGGSAHRSGSRTATADTSS